MDSEIVNYNLIMKVCNDALEELHTCGWAVSSILISADEDLRKAIESDEGRTFARAQSQMFNIEASILNWRKDNILEICLF